MRKIRASNGFSFVEVMVSVSIFGVALYVVFMGLVGTNKTMKFESKMDSAEAGASMIFNSLGRDIRESSYAYIYAGDWYATRTLSGVDIVVARNYFSSNPALSGTTLVPGISNENWAQCPNRACGWSNNLGGAGSSPILPNAFLSRPTRNNPQSGAPTYPPSSFYFSTLDARGRLFGHLIPGDACPICGASLQSNIFFGGLLVFSPRQANGTFSYVDEGDEVQWESMIFYCPFRDAQGICDMRRYVFSASLVNPAACLTDLLDFDDNGIIESPPMTDTFGDFVLDAEGECFSLLPSAAGNKLLYTRWDAAAGRSFRIEVNRATGIAEVTVIGGLYGTGVTLVFRLDMKQFARGLSDFDASSFINNPSWEVGGTVVNPTGVSELGVIRVTTQIDRSVRADPNQVETVQSTMIRPRN